MKNLLVWWSVIFYDLFRSLPSRSTTHDEVRNLSSVQSKNKLKTNRLICIIVLKITTIKQNIVGDRLTEPFSSKHFICLSSPARRACGLDSHIQWALLWSLLAWSTVDPQPSSLPSTLLLPHATLSLIICVNFETLLSAGHALSLPLFQL